MKNRKVYTIPIVVLMLAAMSLNILAAPQPLPTDSSQKYSYTLSNADGDSNFTVTVGETFVLDFVFARVNNDGSLYSGAYNIPAMQNEIFVSTEYFEIMEVKQLEFFGQAEREITQWDVSGEGKRILINTGLLMGGTFEVAPEIKVAQIKLKAIKTGSSEIRNDNAYAFGPTGTTQYATVAKNANVTIADSGAAMRNITITQPANGTITSSKISAAAGERVDLSISLQNSYTFTSWSVKSTSAGTAVSIAGGSGAQSTYFTMPDYDVTVTATLKAPSGGGGTGGGGTGGGGTGGGTGSETGGTGSETGGTGGETGGTGGIGSTGGGTSGGSGSTIIDVGDGSIPTSRPAVPTFEDVPDSHWAYEHIEYLAGKGFVTGKTATLFYPSDSITRAEFVTILARMSGETLPEFNGKFSDVSESAYYARAVSWAIEAGITLGTSDTTFSPNAEIKRQEIAVMIVRYAEYMGFSFAEVNDAITFTDGSAISGYAQNAVIAMQQANIINGYEDGSFKPAGNATRAEAAKMLALVHYGMQN